MIIYSFSANEFYTILEIFDFFLSQELIINQEWLDPKLQLQQSCFSSRENQDVSEEFPYYT